MARENPPATDAKLQKHENTNQKESDSFLLRAFAWLNAPAPVLDFKPAQVHDFKEQPPLKHIGLAVS
jgi:hypothetical protein